MRARKLYDWDIVCFRRWWFQSCIGWYAFVFDRRGFRRLIIELIASIPKASNWAVGTFMVVSFGAHEFCQRRRALERQGMERATEIIDRKKMEKARKAEEARAVRRKAREEAERLKEVEEKEMRKGSDWKFW